MRKDILDSLYGDWIYNKKIENFTLIVTCRENYIPQFAVLKCKYITLLPWDEIQIRSFCNVFQRKTKNNISDNTIEKILESKKILGIPLILYMVVALNISIDKEGSIVDVYDKIFSLDGGIYDRCIDNKMFADKHRISKIKEQIHHISRDIAMWMFENNSEEAYIPKDDYQKICDNIMQKREQKNGDIQQDFLIGNYFKLVKHCEGIETEELYFVHRSIYEYFVAETIYSSIEGITQELSEKSEKEIIKNLAVCLKQGKISKTIGEYIKCKLIKRYNSLENRKKEIFVHRWVTIINTMMGVGMFRYCNEVYENILEKEANCFMNLLRILLILSEVEINNDIKNINKNDVIKYLKLYFLNCKYSVKIFDLSGCFLEGIDLNVDFGNGNLERADLVGADLKGANLENAYLENAILDESQVAYLKKRYRLEGTIVCTNTNNTKKYIKYEEYCKRQ